MNIKLLKRFCLKIKPDNMVLKKESLDSITNIENFSYFKNIINGNDPVLLFGILNYCKNSKQVLPNILDQYSNDFEYNKFYKFHVFDMEKLSDITNYLSIKESPCLILFNNKNIIDIIKGRPSLNQVRDLIFDIHKIIKNNKKSNNWLELSENIINKIFNEKNYQESIEELDFLIEKFKNNDLISLEILKAYCLFKIKKFSKFEELMNNLVQKEDEINKINNNKLKELYENLKSKSLSCDIDINNLTLDKQIEFIKENYENMETIKSLNIIYDILNNKGIVNKKELIKIGNYILSNDNQVDSDFKKSNREKWLKYLM